MKKKKRIRHKHLYAIIGILFGLLIIQTASPVQDAVAQLIVFHPLEQISTDGVNSIDSDLDGRIDVNYITQGDGSGLDADLIDGRIVDSGTIWTSGNDLQGSTLNADTLDDLELNEIEQNILAQVPRSSVPVYEIKSTTTGGLNNNGQWKGSELGGRKGANDKCKAEHGPDAVMFGTQHINCYTRGTCMFEWQIWEDFTDPTYGTFSWHWFDETRNTPISNGGGQVSVYDVAYPNGWYSGSTGNTPYNCLGWSSDAGNGIDGRVVNKNGNENHRACIYYTLRIACAVPK